MACAKSFVSANAGSGKTFGLTKADADQEKVRQLWHQGYAPWFPEGPGDGSIALVRVRVEEAEYWDAKANRMVLLTGFVAPGSAFRDREPGMGI